MWVVVVVVVGWVCRCFADGAYTQAVGIALESRRLDKVLPPSIA